MAELLSPGIFVEEVPSQVQVIQAVSTSNLGIVGFTQRGPTDEATLVGSFEEFTKKFGSIVKESFVPLSMAAYFSNGGRRAFVVRVAPGDAVAADCKIQSQTSNQQIETGNSTAVTFTKTAATSILKDNDGASPIIGSGFSLRWREDGTAHADQQTRHRDGTTNLAGDGASDYWEGRIRASHLPATDPDLQALVHATVHIKWTDLAAVAQDLTIPAPVSGSISSASTANGSTATVDHQTGRFTLFTDAASMETSDTTDITASYISASATKIATSNGAGTLSGDVASGSVTLTNGAYTFTTNFAPHNGSPILATYKINAWDLDPVSKGAWGNDLRIDISGHPDFFTAATSSYSRHNVSVLLRNSTGAYEIQETYEELDFSDPNSAVFWADVLNELSDLVSVVEPGGNEAPGQLNGVGHTFIIAGGDTSAAGRVVTSTAASSNVVIPDVIIASRSVVITYTSGSVAKTITADAAGALSGDVDGSYATSITLGGEILPPNTISYTSGRFNFKTAGAIDSGTFVLVTYETKAAETLHTELFGDVTKGYTEGEDGTFDSTNYGRSQFTDPSLGPLSKGMFALSKIDEIMQVAIPDFAGDITITGDQLDYAAARANQPSGGDRFIVLTTPIGSSAQDAVDWFRFQLGRFSKFAAVYWPWIRVANPLANGLPLTMPPLGHVAGIYARTDATKNVAKSPGGTVDGALSFLLGLEIAPSQAERDFVFPNKINSLISSPQTGLAVWGVRTISNESDWRFVSVRRLFMFLEKSIYNSTFWIVFENNGPGLWARIKAQLVGFLTGLFNDGLFAGTSPAQAFFVIVDSTNNTPASIAAGQVVIDVGVAATTPAEFCRFRFTQISLQS